MGKMLIIKGLSSSPAVTSTAATPSISVSASGTVTITCATSGAAIYYTTDGTTPKTSSTRYTSSFTVSGSGTVKAVAVKSGYNNSAVASKAFSISTATPTAATPVISISAPSDGSCTVNISCATSGATIYYTTDGSTPTTSSSVWASSFTVSGTGIVKAYAVKSGYNDSSVASASYDATDTEEDPTPQVAKPVISATSDGLVSITCATSGATIYYTTNGTTPTSASSAYTSTFTVADSCTVKAVAIMDGYTDSAVASKFVTVSVSGDVATPVIASNECGLVTISCDTAGAEIYYTIDGSEPSSSSTRYYSRIIVPSSTIETDEDVKNNTVPAQYEYTVKAIAIKSGNQSEVASHQVTRQILNIYEACSWKDHHTWERFIPGETTLTEEKGRRNTINFGVLLGSGYSSMTITLTAALGLYARIISMTKIINTNSWGMNGAPWGANGTPQETNSGSTVQTTSNLYALLVFEASALGVEETSSGSITDEQVEYLIEHLGELFTVTRS